MLSLWACGKNWTANDIETEERESCRAPSSSPGCRTSGYKKLVADSTAEERDQDSATKGNDYVGGTSDMATAIKAGRTDDVQRKLKTLQTPGSVCVLCVTKQNLNPGYPACPVQTKVGHGRPPEKPLFPEGFTNCQATTRSTLVCNKSSINSFGWFVIKKKGMIKYDFFFSVRETFTGSS